MVAERFLQVRDANGVGSNAGARSRAGRIREDLALMDLSSKIQREPRAASRMIGDLIVSAGETLEIANRLADITGQIGLAKDISSVRSVVMQFAATADKLSHDKYDAETLRAAFNGMPDLGEKTKLSSSRAMKFFLYQRVRICMPALRPSEASVLVFLIENADREVSKEMLKMAVKSRSLKTHVVKVYVSRIRVCLAEFGIDNAILSRPGGYCLPGPQATRLVAALNASGFETETQTLDA